MKPLMMLRSVHEDDAGQGLVEYVLIFGLIAFSATAGMSTLAASINSTFTQVSSIIGDYIT